MVKQILNRKKVDPYVSVFTGNKQVEKISLQLFEYNSEECNEITDYDINDFDGFKHDNKQYWLNIHGIHDAEVIKSLAQKLQIDNLVIQDILDVNQRPKFQEFDSYWFFTLKSIVPSSGEKIEQEQISFILGDNYLVSFQERKGDYFTHIRERLRKKIGLVRDKGVDFLLFLLLEAILDNYFKTVNDIENSLDNIIILDLNRDVSPNVLNSIEQYKHHIHQLKKTILPIKEFVTRIEREKFSFIQDKNIKYFYELKDLCFSLIDDCEYLMVKLESGENLFFSVQGHRMNQVMKTLTVVSTIFIPLTFLAGIYGMNFVNMPELGWQWGYWAVLILMVVITGVMLSYFRRKRWF